MAGATPSTSQTDLEFVNVNHIHAVAGLHETQADHTSDSRYSDSDGMQYFDFDAFVQDGAMHYQESFDSTLKAPDAEMTTDDVPFENGVYSHALMESDGQGYSDAQTQDTRMDRLAETEQEADDVDQTFEDDDAALYEAAFQSYRNDNPLMSRLIPRPPKDFAQQLTDPEQVTSLEKLINLETLRRDEKWHVDKESAEFLASVMALTSADDFEATFQRSLRNPLRQLRLEDPILETDPRMDMINLFKRNEVRLSDDVVETIPLDDEKDEGLNWSKEAQSLPVKLRKDVTSARLGIDKGTMEYLHEIYDGPKIDLDEWLQQDREKRLPPGPVSPTLLPLSPPYSPGGVDPEAADFELTSSPQDPAMHDVTNLSTRLLELDDVEMRDGAEEAEQSWNEYVASSSSPLKRKVSNMKKLKVSSPLMPLEDSSPPSKKAKTVCFPDELETLIPQPSESDSIDPCEVADEACATLEQMINPSGRSVHQQIQNEELVEADTTLRVPVPTLDQVKATAPWVVYADADGNADRLESQSRLIKDTKDGLLQSEAKWSISSKLEKDLSWSPFSTHLGRLKPESDFDDGSLARYFAELDIEGDVDLECLVWKPDGLRVLDCDEDEDEELDSAEFEAELDGAGNEEPEHKTVTRIEQQQTVSYPSPAPVTKSQRVPGWTPMDALLQKRKIQLEEDKKALSNESGLDSFARVQGFKNVKPRAQTKEAVLTNPSTKQDSLPYQEVRVPSPPKHALAIPVPELPQCSSPLQVIISFALMKNHQFVRRLQKLLPTVDLIDRDFAAVISDATSNKAVNAKHDLEADLTISPSTGLMITNLQKLKQKPLPGQHNLFGIREQITLAAPRYERLIVLVSDRPTMDDDQAPLQNIDANDSAALTDFINQTAVLDTDVQVVYVAGGIETLAKWTAATIARVGTDEYQLLREETIWERFLRKAGMNAYAAQVVLGSLKPGAIGSGPRGDSSSKAFSAGAINSGLAAFVMMDAEERIQRFGPVMGGDGFLRRVNRFLEASWAAF